jgi:hypothetical protein
MVGKPQEGRRKALTPAQAQRRYRQRKKHVANRFHRGSKDGKHYWLTPPDIGGRVRVRFRSLSVAAAGGVRRADLRVGTGELGQPAVR